MSGRCRLCRTSKRDVREPYSVQTPARNDGTFIKAPKFVPSELVNAAVYASSRILEIDEDERLNWPPKAVALLSNESLEPEVLQTAIRRGVPDCLKKMVFLRAHRCSKFLENRPDFYKETLTQTFGAKVPTFPKDCRVPTFSGGFLGIEEELSGSPVKVEKLETDVDFDVSRKEISWTDLGCVMSPHTAPCARSFVFSTAPASDPNSPRSSKSEFFEKNRKRDALSAVSDEVDDGLNYGLYSQQTPRPPLPLHGRGKGRTKSDYNYEEDDNLTYGRSSQPLSVPRGTQRARRQSDYKSAADRRAVVDGSAAAPDPTAHLAKFRSFSFDEGLMLGGQPPQEESDVGLRSSRPEVSHGARSMYLTPPRGRFRPQADVYTLEGVAHLSSLLSDLGLASAKRILWCLSACYEDIEFAPLLPNLICVLLMYLSEAETFALITRVLQIARERRTGDYPFLIFRRTEFVRFIHLVLSAVGKHVPRVLAKCQPLDFDMAAWLARTMSDGLARSVPFNALLRIYTAFLFEGSRVFVRYVVVLLKLQHDRLIRCKTREEWEHVLHGPKHGTLAELNTLTKLAFRLPLATDDIERFSSHKLPTPYLMGVRVERFYRPRLGCRSDILRDDEWESVWSWIPHRSRILDPVLVWRSSRDGCSISALLRSLGNHSDNPMVFFILTDMGEVIGGYFSRAFTLEKARLAHTSPAGSVVFRLRPEVAAYHWSGKNPIFIEMNRSHISIGGNDVAIYIDHEILAGRSAPSDSFFSPQLAGGICGDFVITRMEVWILN